MTMSLEPADGFLPNLQIELDETVQMRGHNIFVSMRNKKNYRQILSLI